MQVAEAADASGPRALVVDMVGGRLSLVLSPLVTPPHSPSWASCHARSGLRGPLPVVSHWTIEAAFANQYPAPMWRVAGGSLE